jgi:hypothetical protein
MYGYQGSSRAPTGAQGAFGQTFTIAPGSTMNVSGLSFWLNYDPSVTAPSFRAYIQELNTGNLLFSSVLGGSDQSVTNRQGMYAEHSVAIGSGTPETSLVLQAGQYVAFFSGIGLNLAGMPLVPVGAAGDTLATGTAVVSNAGVRAVSGYFGSTTTYRSLSTDLAMSIKEATSTVIIVPPPPPPPPPPDTTGHSPEPASCLMWLVLGSVALLFGWRTQRTRRR